MHAEIVAVLRARVAAGELRRDLDVELAGEVLQQILLGYSVRTAITRPRAALARQLELVFAAFRG